jgi:hypothetical protein
MTENGVRKTNFHFKSAIIFSFLTGLSAQVFSYLFDYTYAYRDSIFRMEAARRFFDSIDPGIINQIGTVWLPVPNLILMPFAAVDYLYQTGLAASIVNLPAFVISSIFIFLALKEITNNTLATWTGFVIYILNYNILYYQTTAMTEQLYLTFLAGNFYFLYLWSKKSRLKHLIYSSVFMTLCAGSRYDAWPVFLGSAAIVIIISLYKKEKYIRDIIIYSALPTILILWWFLHNYIYYGDPFEFSRGRFSTLHQLRYYEEAGRLLTKDNFILSAKVYLFSVLYYSGNLYFAMAFAGIIYYIIINKFRPDSFVPYILLIAIPTTLILLFKGQLIIEHPSSDPPGYFNSRYGLYLFPAIAIFSGYSVLLLKKYNKRKKLLIFLLGTGIVIQQLTYLYNFPYSIPSLAEAKYAYSQSSIDLSVFMKDNYKGGKILYDNTVFALHPWACIDLKERITFHTYILGEKAMSKPSDYVEWVIFYKNSPNDKIKQSMDGNEDFLKNFGLKFEENGIEVYKRKR